MTVTECAPTDNAVVMYVATPDAFKLAVPSVTVPSLKVMVPLGVAPVPVVVAVKVTDW